MTRPECLLTLRVPALAEELQGVRQQLEQVLIDSGVDLEQARQLVVAVNEACMNIVQHAYGSHYNGDMVLEVELDPAKWLFRLKDYAPRIDTKRLKPRDLSVVRPGGLGLSLIDKIMDDVRYPEPPDGVGNILELTKYRGARQEQRDGAQ